MAKSGYVYFFKHRKIKGIKIGYSSSEYSLMDRFNSLKVFAPLEPVFVGYIRSINARSLELDFHKRFDSKRMNGEWFDINPVDIKNEKNFINGSPVVKNENKWMFKVKSVKVIKCECFEIIHIFFNDFDFNNKSIFRDELMNNFTNSFPDIFVTAQKFNNAVRKHCSLNDIKLVERKINGKFIFNFRKTLNN